MKKFNDIFVKRLFIVNILLKSLLEDTDIRSLRISLEELVLQGILTESESKKIRETFRDLIADLDEIAPVTTDNDTMKTDILLAKLTISESKSLSKLVGESSSYSGLTAVREFFSQKGEKLSLLDCKNIIGYLKKNI